MEAAGTQKTSSHDSDVPEVKVVRISWELFRRKYLGRESRYKYEWVNGIVEKTAYTMNPDQLYIQYNLQDFFARLLAAGKVSGQLLGEPDLLFSGQVHRRPDMAWLTREQVERLSMEGAIAIPAFVIEVISNNDAAARLMAKMEDYRRAGVQVVWHIYPRIKQVHVYSGEELRHSTVLSGEEVCSAAPALPAFELPASDIFRVSAS